MIAQGTSAAGVMEACRTIEDPSKPWLRTCLRYEAAGEDRCAD